jgi:hypothetical protein
MKRVPKMINVVVVALFAMTTFLFAPIVIKASETDVTYPIPIILDEDFCTDVDDVEAVRIATALSDAGYAEIRAIMLSTSGYANTHAMHGLLCYDGYPNVPIGVSSVEIPDGSPYWGELWHRYSDETTLVTADAVNLYKAVLASTDRKIRIITTGYVTNIAELLKDPDGYALVAANVDSIYITGGAYPNGTDNNFWYNDEAKSAIRYVTAHSPVPLIFSTSETYSSKAQGNLIWSGDKLFRLDKNLSDPVTLSLSLFAKENNLDYIKDKGWTSADPICVYAVIIPSDQSLLSLYPTNIYIAPNGANTFDDTLPLNCYVIQRQTEDLKWYQNQLNYWLCQNYCLRHPESIQ